MSLRTTAIVTLLVLFGAFDVAAENWPQWRGPKATGASGETGLPTSWSEGENVSWKLELPALSGSTPIIWGRHLFLNVGQGEELFLWAIDSGTGEILWRRRLGDRNHMMRKQNMSSPSPVTDGESVWVVTGTGLVKSFDFSGEELWTRNLPEEYGPIGIQWGYASSPLLMGDALIVQVIHGMKTDDPSYVLSLDAATGKNRWRVERPSDAVMESPDAYTTPAVVETGEGQQIVISGADYVTGHDPATGREIWRGGGLNPRGNANYRVVASPVVAGGLIFVPSRVNPLLTYRPGGEGDITSTHLAWSLDKGPDVPTPATDGRYLYILRDRGTLSNYDTQTGEAVWAEQRVAPGTYSASPVLADGKVYVTNEEGVTTVVKAGAEFEILAENELDGYTLSSIAVSEGRIFFRTDKYLYCLINRAL